MHLPTIAGTQVTLLGASPQLLGAPRLYGPAQLYGLGEETLSPEAAVANEAAAPDAPNKGVSMLLILARTAAIGADAYHGYKRNNSVAWAVWWGVMGGMYPIVTTGIALAQGFGKEKR